MSTRDQLISYLKQKKGEWVSGQSLSNSIAVSRSAIWKHICTLRDEGYVIESSPKKGYCLQKVSEMLLPREIKEGLETKVFGKGDIIYFSETDSTNTRAKELATQGAPEGTLVVSEEQTGGRGRKGREWFSPSKGGIYLSLILRPTISPGEAPKITLLTAVATAEALLSLTQLEIRIKWPNDILVNGKKLVGILTEMSTDMDKIDYVVVGLGLNVNTPGFPKDISDKATSLFIETGKQFSRARLVAEFLKMEEHYYELFKKVGFEPVITRWKELADIIGKQIAVEMIDQTLLGEVQDIDGDGFLILRDNTGTSHRIISGDVILR
ncbi:MAG: biotin--[acetyl-CoA-carboxylase] ligase [Desulfobacteraceae bacterium]|nr:biotin--[acetyl-CoA-carboxylase] ligase [Desulfobacteraceae bacterium]